VKKYLARAWGGAVIMEVEVSRETSSTVFINGNNRRAKVSDGQKYCDTWQEAKDYLLQDAGQKLITARRQLEIAQGKLGNIKGMKEPV